MTVKSTERNGNVTTIVVEIDNQKMQEAAEKAYKKARKNIAIPGFRKGKAPRFLVEKMYGAHVFYEDGLEEIFPEIYEEAVINQGVQAVGQPSLTAMDIHEDGSVEITLTTEVYPEVTLGQYKGLKVERVEPSVSEESVQAELDEMAKKVAAVETVERPAQEGDTAVIDFEGFDAGVPFDGGKGENHELVLGSHSFVPGFEEQVVGMSVGEEKDIDITFPEDYTPELAGKPVVFHVKLNKLTVSVVPALDDDFAKDVSEFDTLDELKADILAKQLEKVTKQADAAFEEAAVEKAAEGTTVEMPKALVERALDDQMQQFSYQLQMSGLSMEQYAQMMGGDMSKLRDMFRPGAEKQAKINVTLAKIVEVEGLTATDEEIEAEYARLAESYSLDLSKVKELAPVSEIKTGLETQKASKFVAENAIAVAPKKAEETQE